MLTKRTQILFDDTMWQKLLRLAERENISVGELTRKAIEKTYFSSREELKDKKEEAYQQILAIREKLRKSKKTRNTEDSVTIIRRMREERTKHLLDVIEGRQ